MDTEPEPIFDALIRTARAVCGVPIALVSLVDADRQWFKSRVGLAASETPRAINVEAPLHHTVFDRFGLGDRAQHYGVCKPYRPTNLSSHTRLTVHYNCDSKVQ